MQWGCFYFLQYLFSTELFCIPSSGLTAIATYLLTKELWNDRAGLFAACFIAIGESVNKWFEVIVAGLPQLRVQLPHECISVEKLIIVD